MTPLEEALCGFSPETSFPPLEEALMGGSGGGLGGEHGGEEEEDTPLLPRSPSNLSLLWLDLSDNNLSDNGGAPGVVSRLIHSLLGHPTLRHLNLSRNRLGVGYAAAPTSLALVSGLVGNSTLESLYLDGNSLDSQALLAAAIAANPRSSLTHLSLRLNRCRTPGASAFAALIRSQTPHPPLGSQQGQQQGQAVGGEVGVVTPPPPAAPPAPPAPPAPSPTPKLVYLDVRAN